MLHEKSKKFDFDNETIIDNNLGVIRDKRFLSGIQEQKYYPLLKPKIRNDLSRLDQYVHDKLLHSSLILNRKQKYKMENQKRFSNLHHTKFHNRIMTKEMNKSLKFYQTRTGYLSNIRFDFDAEELSKQVAWMMSQKDRTDKYFIGKKHWEGLNPVEKNQKMGKLENMFLKNMGYPA